ncbi:MULTISPECIES: hypothetical protein [unclassified Bradyrhizobium]|uniref:hypothetical protein n=1 Tax=Bradyrhizobium sp. USDA 4541 TaxID=2817704 RepID=UPI0020A2DBF9|nr:hypothetical protein [Bradyrhizobium sp. USDA 4541]MCP1854217.1 hypothetical protein [Bradyrhizobium sp. USDA 4541]
MECLEKQGALPDADPAHPAAQAASIRAGEETFDLARELLETEQMTLCGIRELLSYVCEFDGEDFSDDIRFPNLEKGTRKHFDFLFALVRRLAVAMESIAPASAATSSVEPQRRRTVFSPPKTDPTFEAIDAHREARDVVVGADDDDMPDEDFALICKRETDAAQRLAETVPSTLQGLHAMLTYIDAAIERQDSGEDDGFINVFGDDSPPVFSSLAKAAKALLPATSQSMTA